MKKTIRYVLQDVQSLEQLESRLGSGTPRSLPKIDRVTAKVCLPSGSNIAVEEQNRMIDAFIKTLQR